MAHPLFLLRPGLVNQQPIQNLALSAIERYREPQALDLRLDAPFPELHAVIVEKVFGDFYAVCSCGALSLPFVSRDSAERWECPRAAAEAEIAHWIELYVDRVKAAAAAGYR